MPDTPAPWSMRAAAFAIDLLPGVGIVATMGVAALTVPWWGLWWWLWVSIGTATVLLIAINRLILPVVTGRSLGRARVGIRVVCRDGAAAGPARLLLRDLAHLADTVPLLLGWLWPLWDSRRRTFADLLTRTEVRRVAPSERDLQRPMMVLLVAASLLCAAAAAVSYFGVHQRETAVDAARADIARQGPKIVAEMLSYEPGTIDDDFARARDLTTERYRGELDTGQQKAREAPARHAYMVPNSAVLTIAPDRATMLLYLRGEVGQPPKVWNSTATAVVEFVKADQRWLVDDVTIVPNARPGEEGP